MKYRLKRTLAALALAVAPCVRAEEAALDASAASPPPAAATPVEATPVEAAPVETAPTEPLAPEAGVPSPLDLKTAQQIALDQNYTLRAVEEAVAQAQARVRQARAAYFPQIEAQYTASHTELPNQALEDARKQARQQVLSQVGQSVGRALSSDAPNAALGAVGGSLFGLYTGSIAYDAIDDSMEKYQASLTARYLVFDGFARRFQYAQARFGAQETAAARREAQRLILDGVAKAFYGVQLARENAAIFRAALDFNQRLLDDAKARRERGLGSLSDELNFEVLLRAAKAQLLIAEGEYRSARIALAALMGLPEAGLPESVEIAPLEQETAEDMALPEAGPLITLAEDLRPDLERQDFALKRANAAVRQKQGAYYPQVGAFASADASRSENSRLNADDVATTVGVNVRYDLFTGGRNRASVAEAKHAAREAEARLNEARVQAGKEIRQALEQLRTAQAGLVLQRTAAELVEKNRQLVEKEYAVGQTALVRLNQAQRDLVEAQARLALSRVNLKATWHDLRTATGETTPQE